MIAVTVAATSAKRFDKRAWIPTAQVNHAARCVMLYGKLALLLQASTVAMAPIEALCNMRWIAPRNNVSPQGRSAAAAALRLGTL